MNHFLPQASINCTQYDNSATKNGAKIVFTRNGAGTTGQPRAKQKK